MKLIKEYYDPSHTKFLVEKAGDGKKNYFIEGIFMQTKPNRNGRRYNRDILEKELSRYESYIKEKRALGELGHPDTPTINLRDVSHLITELRFDGDDIVGRAKILNTPNGIITKNFIDEGIGLGVSSRGVGSLKMVNGINEVQDDFKLSTIDIVADPSAPDAWVTGLVEGREWIFIEGKFEEVHIDKAQQILRKTPQKELEKVALQLFENFLKKI